ncbi:MAG: urea carboxylase-associated family protein [Candidatus Eremiobacteraeota bacterium]|nr:urea carboxylase-associated family protein [Candidatus Eremiobacteraeota bacterium]
MRRRRRPRWPRCSRDRARAPRVRVAQPVRERRRARELLVSRAARRRLAAAARDRADAAVRARRARLVPRVRQRRSVLVPGREGGDPPRQLPLRRLRAARRSRGHRRACARPVRVRRRAEAFRERVHHLRGGLSRARARRRACVRARAVVAAAAPARPRRAVSSVGCAGQQRSGRSELFVQRRGRRVLRDRDAPERVARGAALRLADARFQRSRAVRAPARGRALPWPAATDPRARAAARWNDQPEPVRLRLSLRGSPVFRPGRRGELGVSVHSEALTEIPPRSGTAFVLERGEELTIVDPDGGQVADLVAFVAGDVRETLSNGRTFDYERTLALTAGNRLWSNRSRPLLTIVRDDVGTHDFLLTACSRETWRICYGGEHDDVPGCFGNLVTALAPFGIEPHAIPTTFNVFMHVAVGPGGALTVLPPRSRAGDALVLRAEERLVIGLTACSAAASNGGTFKPIRYGRLKPASE